MRTIRRCVDWADQGPVTGAYKAKSNWIDLRFIGTVCQQAIVTMPRMTVAGGESLLSLMDGEDRPIR